MFTGFNCRKSLQRQKQPAENVCRGIKGKYDSKNFQLILKESKRFQKNPTKIFQKFQKILKDSKKFQKNLKEFKRLQKNLKEFESKRIRPKIAFKMALSIQKR